MDLGKYQLVLSVSVILAAAVVALLFDYLKRNNEQLRQANREMKARRGQELRHLRLRENAAQTAPPARVVRRAEKASVEAPPVAKAPEVKFAGQEASAMPITSQVMEPEAQPELRIGIRVAAPEPARKPAMSAAVSTPALTESPRRDWSSLLKSARPVERPEPTLEELALAAANDAALPAGFYSESRLSGLLQTNPKVTGMAISIGASFAAEVMPEAIPVFMRSLLEPADFGAQRGTEFVLILSEQLGSASQRRLNHIAQRLWEFQIEGMKSHGTSFSWGGVEVHEIPLEEALNSAAERMAETKRNRKILPIGMRERRAELRRAV